MGGGEYVRGWDAEGIAGWKVYGPGFVFQGMWFGVWVSP